MKPDSILQGNLFECFICHTTRNLHKHHIFYGTGKRELSDQDGCVVWLCQTHHTSNIGVHFDKKKDLWLKEKCQRRWMKKYNKTKEDFIERYGKNYLNE